MSEFRDILNKVVEGNDLTTEEGDFAFDEIMSGKVSDIQIKEFLIALKEKGESTHEIGSATYVMRKKMLTVEAPEGAIDVCGTGGDAKGTYNISTAVSFVVAGCGVIVAKHGNTSVSSKSGSSDVLMELGVNINAPKEVVEKCISEIGIGFLMAPLYHPAMKHVAKARKELGVRTIFNLLGPLLNPAGVKRQLVGVYDDKVMPTVAAVLAEFGSEKAWVVHSEDGLDEISTTGKTVVGKTKNKEFEIFYIHPEKYGLPLRKIEELKGGNASQNAQALLQVLNGEEGAYRDTVLLNAAAALIVADKVEDMEEGIAMAKEAIDSGKALQKLNQLIEKTNE